LKGSYFQDRFERFKGFERITYESMEMYKCRHCDKEYKSGYLLNRHVKSSARCIKDRLGTVEESSKISCPCGYSTSRIDHLARHHASCSFPRLIATLAERDVILEDRNRTIEDHLKTIEDHLRIITTDNETIAKLEEQVKLLMSRTPILNPDKTVVCQLQFEGKLIPIQMRSDGRIDATALCQAGGKLWKRYNENVNTQAYLKILERTVGCVVVDLIKTQTGPNGERHTWVHRKVAIHLAQWISSEFAVQVTSWIEELLITGSVTLSKETSEEEIHTAFREMIAIDLRPYDKKDVLYFGIFDASNDIEFEGELSEDTMLCKFGVSSDIAMRNGSHESGKQFPKFRIVHVVEAGSRNNVSVAEKHVKRVVTQMGLRINYGKSKECFMATEEQLRQVVIRANEFAQEDVEDVEDVPDIRLEMRRLDLEEKKIEMETVRERERERESRLMGLFSEGKMTYEQMKEMLDK
jgi:hypothetical protein